MNPDGTSKLPGATYFLFFVGMLLLNGVVFIPVAKAYKVKNYMQGEDEEEGDGSEASEPA
jgi:POT family proton-dependent oligopeptide transporter